MNTVTPQTTTPPAPVPAGARITKPAPTTGNQPAPPEVGCDEFVPRGLGFMFRNMFSIYGLPASPPTPSVCPSN